MRPASICRFRFAEPRQGVVAYAPRANSVRSRLPCAKTPPPFGRGRSGAPGETRTHNEGVGGPCFIQLDYERLIFNLLKGYSILLFFVCFLQAFMLYYFQIKRIFPPRKNFPLFRQEKKGGFYVENGRCRYERRRG